MDRRKSQFDPEPTGDASDLKRLSSLLDTALDLVPEERAAWLDALPADAQALAPVLRNLLARHASGETLDFIDRPPAFDPPRDNASADHQHQNRIQDCGSN